MSLEETVKQTIEVAGPRLRALLYRYQISATDGEDLLQEALLASLSHWEEIDNKQGWLLVTVRNLCSAYRRRQKCWARLVQATDDESIQMLARALPPPQSQVEINRDLRRLLAHVGEHERYILYLKYVEQLGPSELASRIDCHPASVRKMVLRAMSRLHSVAVPLTPSPPKETNPTGK
jgi:RNA polymerase sigma factor (sigma-70 family)